MTMLEIVIALTLVPLMMIFVGAIWRKYPPKSINWVYGYRTFQAMKSQEAWDYAHYHFGKMSLKHGAALMTITIIFIPLLNYYAELTEGLVGIVLLFQFIIFIIPIIPIEVALKKKFAKPETKDEG